MTSRAHPADEERRAADRAEFVSIVLRMTPAQKLIYATTIRTTGQPVLEHMADAIENLAYRSLAAGEPT